MESDSATPGGRVQEAANINILNETACCSRLMVLKMQETSPQLLIHNYNFILLLLPGSKSKNTPVEELTFMSQTAS
jgi:hypothetical protein